MLRSASFKFKNVSPTTIHSFSTMTKASCHVNPENTAVPMEDMVSFVTV